MAVAVVFGGVGDNKAASFQKRPGFCRGYSLMRRRGRIRRRSQGCGDKKSLSISRLDESEGAKEVKGEGAEKKRKVVLREEVIPQVEYFTGLLSKVKVSESWGGKGGRGGFCEVGGMLCNMCSCLAECPSLNLCGGTRQESNWH